MPRGVARKGQGKGRKAPDPRSSIVRETTKLKQDAKREVREKKEAKHVRDGAPPAKDITAGPTINVTPKGVALPPLIELTAPMRNGAVAQEGDWMTVKSSNVRRIRWDRSLSIEFHSGKVYTYIGVPAEVWRALMQAESHGSFLQTAVINKCRVRKDVP